MLPDDGRLVCPHPLHPRPGLVWAPGGPAKYVVPFFWWPWVWFSVIKHKRYFYAQRLLCLSDFDPTRRQTAILVTSGKRNWSYTISVGPILFSLQWDGGCHAEYRELFFLCIFKALAFMVDIFIGPIAVTLWRFCTTPSTEILDLGLGSES